MKIGHPFLHAVAKLQIGAYPYKPYAFEYVFCGLQLVSTGYKSDDKIQQLASICFFRLRASTSIGAKTTTNVVLFYGRCRYVAALMANNGDGWGYYLDNMISLNLVPIIPI